MTNKKIDESLNGNYDGIQEYDNDLPRWWVYLFVLTVVVGVGYAFAVHVLGAPTDDERLAADMKALTEYRAAFEQAHAPKAEGPEVLLAAAAEATRVESGKAAFALRCAACHGQRGEGLVGPNLTDDSWIHGGKIEQIKGTIEVGVPAKGMMAWKGIMSPEEILNMTAFIWSIRNTNIPGKAPEGQK